MGYSLVATGCFGGVANQNFVDQCSVFVCDDSQSQRLATILMAVFIPLGVCCLCGIGVFFKRRSVSNEHELGSPREGQKISGSGGDEGADPSPPKVEDEFNDHGDNPE